MEVISGENSLLHSLEGDFLPDTTRSSFVLIVCYKALEQILAWNSEEPERSNLNF